MALDARTKSEQLFEEICDEHGIAYTRLPPLEDRQQPDFELMIQGRRVAVEVKQINPNDEDIRYADALRNERFATQKRNPDHVAQRVRKHIKESRSQLRSYLERHPHTPALLVLFDNADNRYTDPYTIQTALHGWEQVVFQVGTAGQETAVIDRGFAPRNNKVLRQDNNGHLSALVTLHECWALDEPHDRFLALQFYHNPFTEHPFDPDWWAGAYVRHFELSEKSPGQYQNWQPIRGANA